MTKYTELDAQTPMLSLGLNRGWRVKSVGSLFCGQCGELTSCKHFIWCCTTTAALPLSLRFPSVYNQDIPSTLMPVAMAISVIVTILVTMTMSSRLVGRKLVRLVLFQHMGD